MANPDAAPLAPEEDAEVLAPAAPTPTHPRWGPATVGVALAILLGGLILRFAGLDRLVTPDEPLWITRSARFARALADGHLAETYQAVHPGVTLMWAGAAAYALFAPNVPALVPGPEELTRQAAVDRVLTPHGVDALALLVDLRTAALLLNALVLIAVIWLLGQAIGPWPALLAALLVAAEPLHAGTSRLLHLDALAAGLLLLAAIGLLRFVQTRGHGPLAIAAVAAALAWLTRTSALYLLAWTGLIFALLLFATWRGRASGGAVGGLIRAGALWGGLALAATLLCWPALWVAPLSTFDATLRGSLDLAGEAHTRQVFFRGEVTGDDPGWSFYPLSLLWRTTPTVLVGLGLAALGVLLPGRGRLDHATRQTALYLTAFGLGYLLLLDTGAKKIDRYILPTLLVADLLAAIGWYWLLTRLTAWPRTGRVRPHLQAATAGLVALAALWQIGLATATAPYFFTYYNPLLGGFAGAREVMMIGWGEGFDQAGAWLDRQPGAAEATVTAGPWSVSLDYFFTGTVTLRDHAQSPGATAREWLTTDYAVVAYPEIQRALIDPTFLREIQALAPAATFDLEGEEMLWIYDLRDRPLPESLYLASGVAFAWPNGLRLVDVVPGNQDFAAGTSVRLSLWLLPPANDDVAPTLRVSLVHPETGERYTLDLATPQAATTGGGALVEGRLRLPAGATPGAYDLCVAAVSNADGRVIPGQAPGQTQPATEICGGGVVVLPPESSG